MKTKPKPILWWAIKRTSSRGAILIHPFYSSRTRKRSIEKLRHEFSFRYTWGQLKAMGFSAIKIQIKEKS